MYARRLKRVSDIPPTQLSVMSLIFRRVLLSREQSEIAAFHSSNMRLALFISHNFPCTMRSIIQNQCPIHSRFISFTGSQDSSFQTAAVVSTHRHEITNLYFTHPRIDNYSCNQTTPAFTLSLIQIRLFTMAQDQTIISSPRVNRRRSSDLMLDQHPTTEYSLMNSSPHGSTSLSPTRSYTNRLTQLYNTPLPQFGFLKEDMITHQEISEKVCFVS